MKGNGTSAISGGAAGATTTTTTTTATVAGASANSAPGGAATGTSSMNVITNGSTVDGCQATVGIDSAKQLNAAASSAAGANVASAVGAHQQASSAGKAAPMRTIDGDSRQLVAGNNASIRGAHAGCE